MSIFRITRQARSKTGAVERGVDEFVVVCRRRHNGWRRRFDYQRWRFDLWRRDRRWRRLDCWRQCCDRRRRPANNSRERLRRRSLTIGDRRDHVIHWQRRNWRRLRKYGSWRTRYWECGKGLARKVAYGNRLRFWGRWCCSGGTLRLQKLAGRVSQSLVIAGFRNRAPRDIVAEQDHADRHRVAAGKSSFHRARQRHRVVNRECLAADHGPRARRHSLRLRRCSEQRQAEALRDRRTCCHDELSEL